MGRTWWRLNTFILGAFSGKDATKVDRSAAYAVRWVAKSLVSNGFCSRCVIEVAYGIGVPHPISIYVNSYGTCKEGLINIIIDTLIKCYKKLS